MQGGRPVRTLGIWAERRQEQAWLWGGKEVPMLVTVAKSAGRLILVTDRRRRDRRASMGTALIGGGATESRAPRGNPARGSQCAVPHAAIKTPRRPAALPALSLSESSAQGGPAALAAALAFAGRPLFLPREPGPSLAHHPLRLPAAQHPPWLPLQSSPTPLASFSLASSSLSSSTVSLSFVRLLLAVSGNHPAHS